jgi:hypothetical protein
VLLTSVVKGNNRLRIRNSLLMLLITSSHLRDLMLRVSGRRTNHAPSGAALVDLGQTVNVCEGVKKRKSKPLEERTLRIGRAVRIQRWWGMV